MHQQTEKESVRGGRFQRKADITQLNESLLGRLQKLFTPLNLLVLGQPFRAIHLPSYTYPLTSSQLKIRQSDRAMSAKAISIGNATTCISISVTKTSTNVCKNTMEG